MKIDSGKMSTKYRNKTDSVQRNVANPAMKYVSCPELFVSVGCCGTSLQKGQYFY